MIEGLNSQSSTSSTSPQILCSQPSFIYLLYCFGARIRILSMASILMGVKYCSMESLNFKIRGINISGDDVGALNSKLKLAPSIFFINM